MALLTLPNIKNDPSMVGGQLNKKAISGFEMRDALAAEQARRNKAVPGLTPKAAQGFSLNQMLPADQRNSFTGTPTIPQVKPVVAPVGGGARPVVGATVPPPNQGNGPAITTDAGQGGSPQAPTPPTITPESAKAQKSAEEAYQKSLTIGPEELSTQEDIDKLIESTKKAYLNTEDQPIAMDFITGQLASIERRATSLAEPLERKLGRIQAARQSSLEASKFALERADKTVAGERGDIKDARTEEESKRRFDVQQASVDRTFEENKRQFGLNYALAQQKASQDASEKAAAGGTTQEKEERKQEVLTLAKSLLGDAKGKSGAIGFGLQKFVPFGRSLGLQPNRAAFEAKVDTLKSNLTLENLKLLKGAMSDKDLIFLNSIATSITTDMSEAEFDKEVNRIIAKLEGSTGVDLSQYTDEQLQAIANQ